MSLETDLREQVDALFQDTSLKLILEKIPKHLQSRATLLWINIVAQMAERPEELTKLLQNCKTIIQDDDIAMYFTRIWKDLSFVLPQSPPPSPTVSPSASPTLLSPTISEFEVSEDEQREVEPIFDKHAVPSIPPPDRSDARSDGRSETALDRSLSIIGNCFQGLMDNIQMLKEDNCRENRENLLSTSEEGENWLQLLRTKRVKKRTHKSSVTKTPSLRPVRQIKRRIMSPMEGQKPANLKKLVRKKTSAAKNDYKYKCKYCSKGFKRAGNKKRHEVIFHEDPNDLQSSENL